MFTPALLITGKVQAGIPKVVIEAAKVIAADVDAEDNKASSRSPTAREALDNQLYNLAHKVACLRKAYQFGPNHNLDFKVQVQKLQAEAADILRDHGRLHSESMEIT